MTQLLAIIFRFLLALFLVRLIVRAVAALFGRPARTEAPARRKGELVRDRVCNTFLPPERAIRAVVAGREEHFCSAACRDRALAAVSRAS